MALPLAVYVRTCETPRDELSRAMRIISRIVGIATKHYKPLRIIDDAICGKRPT